MIKIVIPRRQYDAEPNLKFSYNRRKYGAPPASVRVGSKLEIVFQHPPNLVSQGVQVPEDVLDTLVNSVPGFKKIIKK